MFIAIHGDAERKPKAMRAAAKLGIQPRQFILHVMAPVWFFAAENHDGSGCVDGLDDEILEAITFGVCKSVALLVELGWLKRSDTGELTVPAWAEHEPYFARKAYDKQRKRGNLNRKSGGSQVEVNRKSGGSQVETTTIPPVEEKRREESTTTTKTKAASPPVGRKPKQTVSDTEPIPDDLKHFENVIREWVTYRRKLGKPILQASWAAFLGKCRESGPKLPTMIKQSIANGWQGLFEPKADAAAKTARQFQTSQGQGSKFHGIE